MALATNLALLLQFACTSQTLASNLTLSWSILVAYLDSAMNFDMTYIYNWLEKMIRREIWSVIYDKIMTNT